MSNSWRISLTDFIREHARPVEKFSHQPRLYSLSLEIGRRLAYDDDVVFAAAWLHDLGVFIGHRPQDLEALSVWDNTTYAMQRSPELLDGFGFPAEKASAVVEAIRTHQPGYTPATIEGQILHDADILEQLGAVGVMRTVCKIGRDTRFQDFQQASRSLRSALTDLPSRLQLSEAKALAEPRIVALRSFLESLEFEAAGNLA